MEKICPTPNKGDFEEIFSTEEICREYLAEIRWSDGFKCPRCGFSKYWKMKNCIYRCSSCSLKVSPISGTVFERTHIPLRTLFKLTWHNIFDKRRSSSTKQIQKEFNFSSYKTVFYWKHRFREVLAEIGPQKLSGQVEVSSAYISIEGYQIKSGYSNNPRALFLIFTSVKDQSVEKIRIIKIPDATHSSIKFAIRSAVSKNSIITVAAESIIPKIDGFIFRKDQNKGENQLNVCNKALLLINTWIGKTLRGAISIQNICTYLDDYTFYYNNRNNKKCAKLFFLFLEACIKNRND